MLSKTYWLERKLKGIGEGRIKIKTRFEITTGNVGKTKKDYKAPLNRYILWERTSSLYQSECVSI